MIQCCDLVNFFIIYLFLLGKCSGIILSNEEQPRPSYTAGIKTANWRNPNAIQTHHNYSKVYVHNNPDGPSQYVVTQTEKTQRVYPIYNAHTYRQTSEDSQRVIEVNSQLGRNWTNHGSNIAGNPKNRTVYKRKIQYKTLEIYEKCPENATGQFVYYLSCNQFLNCWKGRGQPQNCSPGTLFNPRTLECDFPDKVECITGPRQNTLQGSRFQNSNVQALCPKEFSGLIPNYTDCTKFLSCNNGQHHSLDCPPGTLFDINQNVCDFHYKATCFDGQSSQSFIYNNNLLEGGQQQNYSDQSGQYHNQKFPGLNQYSGHGQLQGANAGGDYYQTTYGQSSHRHNCNPETQICTYSSNQPSETGYNRGKQFHQTELGSTSGSGLGYKSHDGQLYQTHYGSTVGGTGTPSQGTANGQGHQDGRYYHTYYGSTGGESQGTANGQTYQRQDGQYYPTHYGPTIGGSGSATYGTTNGQGQSGQTYQKQDGQYSQTYYGATVGRSEPPTKSTANVPGQTQDRQYYQTHYGSTVGGSGSASQNIANGQGQLGQISQTQDGRYHQTHYGSSAVGGASFGISGTYDQNINSKLDFGQDGGTLQTGCSGSACRIRPSSSTQFSNTGRQSYAPTGCRLGQQNCGPNFEQSSHSQILITGQTNCNPQVQNCGGTNENIQNNYNSHSSSQYCNPQIQNCRSQHTTKALGYGQSGDQNFAGSQPSGTSQVSGSGLGQQNYNKVCNINDLTCHRNKNNRAGNTNTERNREPKCPDNFQGLTKHPSDCKKFLNCANGQTFIQDCAPGTLFNPTLGNCDFPYNVDCKSTEETTDVNSDHNEEDTESGQNAFYEHSEKYGQNAGHGSIRQETTEFPSKKVTYHQGHGAYDHGQGFHQGQSGAGQGLGTHHIQGVYIQSQKPVTSSYGTSRHNEGFNIYKPVAPIQPHATNDLGQGNDYGQSISDTNRGQIGIVTRPVNPHVNRNIKTKNPDQNQNFDQSIDYVDVFDPDEQKNYAFRSTTPRNLEKSWPPPFPSTDTNADYVFEYDDGEPVTLEPENVFYADKKKKAICGKGDFHCSAIMCISKTMVCDGHRDCQNGKDELDCQEYLERFTLSKNSHLDVLEKQRWINISYTTCALLCIENTKFECRSFNYRKSDRTCFLSDSNIGLSGALRLYYPCDYYELKSATVDCMNLYKCKNDKCITKGQLCDGFDDCGDRQDERDCKPDDFGYEIRLTGSNEVNEGRIEITAFGKTGYICDDQFGINDANVVCKELGFQLGAADIKGNSYYARDLKENNTLYMMDDLNCFGNETTLLNCGFAGWGVHNCRDQEIAGVICKTPQEKCGKGYWKCDTGNECVPLPFVCDGLFDCTDDSDEGSQHCEAATEMRLANGTTNKEGRVEIKHHGIWGTVCDDDFNEDAAKVVCKYFGFRGTAVVKKDAYFGPGDGPIWLDQVNCYGDETELQKCTHWDWGEHNCDHGEDVGVICSNDIVLVPAQRNSKVTNKLGSSTSGPIISCGFRKDNQFLENDLIHARVVSGSVAKKGEYPWQAALRVKGKGKSAHWCGAVIISSRWVLTAAHCLEGYAKGAYIIVAGEYNTDEDEGTEQQKYIDDYFIHEKFRKGHKMNNDIALIKVKGNGFLLNDDVQPICLPDEDTSYERELNCTISGFGSVKSGTSAYSHNLMAAWIPVHNSETCKMPHVYGTALTEGMICAGFLDGGVDACDGDSGGPLACLDDGLFTLYGLTSWGQHCGYANKPGVYVKVAHYRKWIDDVIKQHS